MFCGKIGSFPFQLWTKHVLKEDWFLSVPTVDKICFVGRLVPFSSSPGERQGLSPRYISNKMSRNVS